jgi:hypothetical protein
MAVLSIASGTASGVFRRDGLHDARALRPGFFSLWPQIDCFDDSLHGARAGSV